jgi:hypothetical protein
MHCDLNHHARNAKRAAPKAALFFPSTIGVRLRFAVLEARLIFIVKAVGHFDRRMTTTTTAADACAIGLKRRAWRRRRGRCLELACATVLDGALASQLGAASTSVCDMALPPRGGDIGEQLFEPVHRHRLYQMVIKS